MYNFVLFLVEVWLIVMLTVSRTIEGPDFKKMLENFGMSTAFLQNKKCIFHDSLSNSWHKDITFHKIAKYYIHTKGNLLSDLDFFKSIMLISTSKTFITLELVLYLMILILALTERPFRKRFEKSYYIEKTVFLSSLRMFWKKNLFWYFKSYFFWKRDILKSFIFQNAIVSR